MLVLPVTYSNDVSTGAGAFWPWLVLHVAVLAACGWTLVQSIRLMREGHQHL